MNSEFTSFRLARMSPLIFGLTLTLLALPFAFLASVAVGKSLLLVPALLVIGIYAWVWLRFRPGCLLSGWPCWRLERFICQIVALVVAASAPTTVRLRHARLKATSAHFCWFCETENG